MFRNLRKLIEPPIKLRLKYFGDLKSCAIFAFVRVKSAENIRTAFLLPICNPHLRFTIANICSFEQITIFFEEMFSLFAQFRIKPNSI